MIKMVIVSGENSYSIGDSVYNAVIASIIKSNDSIDFYDNAGNLIMSLFGGSYAVIY